MKLQFKDIIKKHDGQKAFIFAHGPSANPHLLRINEYKKNHIIIGCNEWYGFYTTPPDYWVLASSVQTIRKEINRINASKNTLVYADSVDITDRQWAAQTISSDYLPYDQRHFESMKCGGGKCCDHIIQGRLTIQEELQKLSGNKERYGCGDTVAVHMLALGLLLGCKEIYYTGIDLDYTKGYAKNSIGLVPPPQTEFNDYMDRHLSDIRILKETANIMNVLLEKV